jgi:hypothetical protein
MRKYPAICIFTYNRPDHFKNCIKSLLDNEDINKCKIFVYKDKQAVQNKIIDKKYSKIFKNIKHKKKITLIKRDKNYGLKTNLIWGITDTLKTYSSIIVCEDDLIFSKFFVKYMIKKLNKYKYNNNIGSISGFSFNYGHQTEEFKNEYFLKFTNSWGWATWSDRWEKFLTNKHNKFKEKLYADKKIQYKFNLDNAQPHTDWLKRSDNGKLSSWNIQWEFYCFINNLLTSFPKYTLVENYGFDGSGSHFGSIKNNYQKIYEKNIKDLFNEKSNKVIENKLCRKIISNNLKKSIFERFYNKISIYLRKLSIKKPLIKSIFFIV